MLTIVTNVDNWKSAPEILRVSQVADALSSAAKDRRLHERALQAGTETIIDTDGMSYEASKKPIYFRRDTADGATGFRAAFALRDVASHLFGGNLYQGRYQIWRARIVRHLDWRWQVRFCMPQYSWVSSETFGSRLACGDDPQGLIIEALRNRIEELENEGS